MPYTPFKLTMIQDVISLVVQSVGGAKASLAVQNNQSPDAVSLFSQNIRICLKPH